jgi:hypothetical protein
MQTVGKTSDDGLNSTRKQAEKVMTQAREVVDLLERARELMAEDNAVQPAMEHLYAALQEAEGRANVLEDWHRRTYLPVPERARIGICEGIYNHR